MGMMYAWATPEYLLWKMTLGQIFLYYDKAIQIKNGIKDTVETTPENISELKKIRDQMREDYKKQYGDIE